MCIHSCIYILLLLLLVNLLLYKDSLLIFCQVCAEILLFASGAGIKAQVCSLVELLVTTLYQAHAVFYLPPEGRAAEPGLGYGLLFTTLENVTSGREIAALLPYSAVGSFRLIEAILRQLIVICI